MRDDETMMHSVPVRPGNRLGLAVPPGRRFFTEWWLPRGAGAPLVCVYVQGHARDRYSARPPYKWRLSNKKSHLCVLRHFVVSLWVSLTFALPGIAVTRGIAATGNIGNALHFAAVYLLWRGAWCHDLFRQRFIEAPPSPRQLATHRDGSFGDVPFGEGNATVAPATDGWWDQERTARMAVFSCSLHPIWVHHWFNFMEKWRPSAPLSGSKSQILRVAGIKVLIDQFASASVFHAVFLTATSLMEGRSYAEVCVKLQRDWFTLVKASWSFWCVAHLINFSVVPLHWRVIYANFVSTGWAIFMSKMMSNEDEELILTPVDVVANFLTGSANGVPAGNTVGCAVMSSAWLFIAGNSPFSTAKVVWLTIGGSLCTFVTVSIYGALPPQPDINAPQQPTHAWARSDHDRRGDSES